MSNFRDEIIRLTNEQERKALYRDAETSARELCHRLRAYIKDCAQNGVFELNKSQKIVSGYMTLAENNELGEQYESANFSHNISDLNAGASVTPNIFDEKLLSVDRTFFDSVYHVNMYKKSTFFTRAKFTATWSLSTLGKQRLLAMQRELSKDGIKLSHTWVIVELLYPKNHLREEQTEELRLSYELGRIGVDSAYKYEFRF